MSLFTDYFSRSLVGMTYHAARAFGVGVIGWLVIHFFRAFLKKKIIEIYPDPLRVSVIMRLLTYIMFFIIVTIILHEFDINVTALVGAAGVASLAIGLAAQTSISNIISGIFIMLYHPFDIEDQVVINNIDGRVKEVSLFAVTIRTLDNRLVRIPNEQVIKSNIVNVSKEPFRGFQTTLDITPDSDIESAIKIINQLSQSREYLLTEPAPAISAQEITGTYCRLVVIVWTKQEQWRATRRQFLIDLSNEFKKANITLASPPTVVMKP